MEVETSSNLAKPVNDTPENVTNDALRNAPQDTTNHTLNGTQSNTTGGKVLDDEEVNVDDSLLDQETHRILAQYDAPGSEANKAPKSAANNASNQAPTAQPLERLFDDEMDVDESTIDRDSYRILAQYDDPWADLKDPHVMMNFYRRIFPWKQLFLWLNQDHTPNYMFTNREFAVTLQNDAYLRYNSYSNYLDLQKDIIRLNPSRFEIGPAYSAPPKDRKTIPKAAFKPIQRELVFDIDLTDYDDIRTCCSDKKICKKCWKFISMAVQVLDLTLRSDFGFKHLLWVYSGRRGAHCWVSDEEALRLTDDQRKAIVNYLDIMRGGGSKFGLKVDLKGPLHPMVDRSLNILSSSFVEVALQDQDVFQEEKKWKFLLQVWGNPTLQQEFERQWSQNHPISSHKKWEAVLSYSHVNKKKLSAALDIANNIILHYTYPRIDLEVSKHMNHLLKSPFCVHPATGKVCVPIDPAKITEFDPDAVPDVRDLLRELDQQPKTDSKDGNGETSSTLKTSWSKTSLRPYVEIFEKHVNGLLTDRLKTKKDLQSHSMEF